MDFAFHTITGAIISKQLVNSYDPTVIVFSLLPDLIGATSYQIAKVKYADKSSLEGFVVDFIRFTKSDRFFGNLDRVTYKITHSWLFLVVVILFSFMFFNQKWIILSVVYLSHLLIDLFTHSGEFKQQPFYPVSRFEIKGVSWAKSKKVFTYYWIVLVTIILLQVLFQRS